MNFAIVKIIQSTYRHCDSYKFHSQFKSIVLNTNLINGKTEKEVQNVFQSLTRVTKCSKISRSLYNEGDFCQFFFIYSFLWPALKCDALFYIFLFHQFKSLPDSFKVLSISSATWFLLLFHVAAAYWQVKLVVQFSSSSYTATTMMMMEVIFLLSRCFFLEYVTHYGGFCSHCKLSEESFHIHHHHHLRIRRALFSFLRAHEWSWEENNVECVWILRTNNEGTATCFPFISHFNNFFTNPI